MNLRKNSHRRGKSGCKISNDHYGNVCKNVTFSVQVIEKLPGNGCEKGTKDIDNVKITGWKHFAVYHYDLNERSKFMVVL